VHVLPSYGSSFLLMLRATLSLSSLLGNGIITQVQNSIGRILADPQPSYTDGHMAVILRSDITMKECGALCTNMAKKPQNDRVLYPRLVLGATMSLLHSENASLLTTCQ
jgi:hypothetical protein